ncbi:hypothetical protein [Haladaptatus sp. DYF46]|uniref:hypothetical protein n=1 Tax=Haladaptatus sp. DYF46 TaxID=2886041 RepID=UPI001E3E14C5|nr:hypothetical protein [Haladaptatus sp. DYF46]
MNKLAAAGEADGRWRLPQHAHIIVYEAEGGDELLTIYDCGAAQKPPSAQLIGNLVRVRADHELERTITGYIVSMREESVLERQEKDHFVIVSDE